MSSIPNQVVTGKYMQVISAIVSFFFKFSSPTLSSAFAKIAVTCKFATFH